MENNVRRIPRRTFGALCVFLILFVVDFRQINAATERPTETGRTCHPDRFRCNDGQCIPNRWVCDYHKDCEHGEDEDQSCPPPICLPSQISCAHYIWNHTYCLPKHYKCDKRVDCIDGSDEGGCTYRQCMPTDFHCNIGLCIPSAKNCDGYYDCRDLADEEGCGITSCNLDQFRCANNKKCLEQDKKCNHHDDCGDNSDEQDCPFPACHESQFRCANSVCIPKSWRCDSHNDCSDNSDEQNCTNVDCPANKFLCPQEKKCIDNDKLCDGVHDCVDGVDENQACSNEKCSSMGCEHDCRKSITGGVCTCPSGYFPNPENRQICTNRNECLEWGYCDQQCVDSDGSYTCSCGPGYTLTSNGVCEANASSVMRLIFAYHNHIYIMDRTGQDFHILTNTTNAAGVDYDYNKGLIFWSDLDTRKVYSLRYDGTPYTRAQDDISFPGPWTPIAIAIDWIGSKLYVCDNMGLMVSVFELDGRWRAIIVSSNLTAPNDIALDPTQGFMFIADSSQVVRANMDGTHLKILIKETVNKAFGVAVDYASKRLYWCDNILDQIETSDYEGLHRFQVVRGSSSAPSPNKLTVFENRVYWTDGTRQGVAAVLKFNGADSVMTIFQNKSEIIDPRSIRAMHPLLQPTVPNPCGQNNGQCQHMCVLTHPADGNTLGYRCICNIGYRIRFDQRTCDVVDEFLIYSQQRFIHGILLDQTPAGFNEAMVPVVSRASRYVGLDFDAHENYVYFSDVISDVIFRVRTNGTGKESVLASQNEGVEGLALDWVTKNLYYIDSQKGTLNVLRAQNNTQGRVLIKDLRRPRGLVVHPNRGFLFFSEWDRPANVSRAYLDGTNKTVFEHLSLGWPNGLALDYDEDRLYWCDALLDHVQHSALDGSDVKTLSSRFVRHPFSLVIHQDFLYVTDWRLDAILRLNKRTGEQEHVLVTAAETNRLYGVKVYSKQLQDISTDHPCVLNNGGCEKFCFAVPAGVSDTVLTVQCGCPYGERLRGDARSCVLDPASEPPVEPCQRSGDFTCNNKRCVPKTWVCDGDDDCMDNSDEEQNCTKPTCSAEEFQCTSGRCIPLYFKCDSDNDCGDHSDETGCANVTCNTNEFACSNGRCIPASWKCDTDNDCGDSSDEGDFCKGRTCAYYQFPCPNSGHCIPQTWVCDGDNDCFDHADEESCPPTSCTSRQFRCNNGKHCIHETYKCDGILDCEDGSDEHGCPTRAPHECDKDKQFQCATTKICIPRAWFCDGNADCMDKSDEPQNCGDVRCPDNMFRCDNGRCVTKTWICDGSDDCGDKSDEDERHACVRPKFTCASGMWTCPGGDMCLNMTQVCDKHIECPKGGDEGPGCESLTCKTSNHGCSHGCKETPAGLLCTCPEGEKLEGKVTCVDLNECDDPSVCSQNCTNTKGSYKCSCSGGYILERDKQSCKANDASSALLVISNRRSILTTDLETRFVFTLPVRVENVVSITSDMKNNIFYWSDMKLRKIFYNKGEEVKEVISSGLDLVEGLAYDWIGKKLYWVDSRLDTLEVATIDGSLRIVLVNENIEQPRGLSLDPTEGARFVFWSDWGTHPRIERMGMDGSERMTIISTKIFWPNGLTLDLPTKRVYFADSKLDYIDFCNYDGTKRHQVLAGSHYLLHLHSLTIFEDRLFWTDRQLNRVITCNKYFGNNQTIVTHMVGQPLGIHVSHPVLQPDAPSPCDGAPCSHLCLLSPRQPGFTCKCPPGFAQDRTAAGGQCIHIETPFLMVMEGSYIIDVSIRPNDTARGAFSPIVGTDRAIDFDYDKKENIIYWVDISVDDVENGTLYQMNITSGNQTSFLKDRIIGAPYAIAFDWVGRNLYLGNRKASNFKVVKTDSADQHQRIILGNDGTDKGVAKPKSMCIDPSDGKLYWLDEGGAGVPVKVGKVDMDGKNPTVLVKDGLAHPEYITIDLANKQLFWSSSQEGKIETADVNGNNRRTLLDEKHGLYMPKALAVYQSTLFYIDTIQEKIMRVNLPNGDGAIVIKSDVTNLKSLKVFMQRPAKGNHPCQVNNGGCQHICVPASNNQRACVCSTGFRSKEKTQCDAYSSFVVTAQASTIRGFSVEDKSEAMQPFSGGEHNIVHIDVDVAKNYIYWVDFDRLFSNGIFRVHPDGTELEGIITDGIGSNGVRGLAVDWIAGNLYFTNSFHHETYIEVSRTDGSHRLVLVKTSTDEPKEIVVNPVKRYLYWIDSGQYPKIERALLDATNRTAIVVTGISVPRDLTIDMLTHDVYWVDSREDAIQRVSFDGQKRQIIRGHLPHPIGVALLNDHVYWVDLNIGMLYRDFKNGNDGNVTISPTPERLKAELDNPRDVAIFDAAIQPTAPSQCAMENKECSQLCFAMPEGTTGHQRKCRCATGVLASDFRSCEGMKEFLVLVTRTEIHHIALDGKANPQKFQLNTTLINALGVDFDFAEEKIFFTEIRPNNQIAWFSPSNPSEVHVILNQGITPEGIAVDWTSNKVYWADSANESIYAMNYDGSHIVFITHVERPRAIVLDPCRGHVYYSDLGRIGNNGKIYRANMVGNNKTVIIGTDLAQPSGLAIDYDEDRLYWTDAVREKIERAFLNGTMREVIVAATIYPFSITVFDNSIFWTDIQLQGVYRAEKHTGASVTEIVKRLDSSPRDLHIYSKSRQFCDFNPCNINNGGCQQSCHHIGNGTIECLCNSSYTLVNDGRMCVEKSASNLSCDASKFACHNGKCIARLWACDGSDDCGDNSDEESIYCSLHTCGTTEYRCDNGRCIYRSWRCDHEDDCGDKSDERNCEYKPCNTTTEFTCKNSRCVAMSHTCNGIDDCKDGAASDEDINMCKDKQVNCTGTGFKCETTNICVESFWLCDRDNDCGDNSDENALICSQRTCPPNSFRCPNHRCIPATWHCDGDDDCGDKSDEPDDCKSEGRTCFGDLFTCDNGNCIPKIYMCDGDNDCLDNSDEDARHQCNNRNCNSEEEFKCEQNKQWGRAECIPKRWVCDGDPDCIDGADENSTLHSCPPPQPCNEDKFQCSNGRCINKGWVCDHDNDCGDGSDEHRNCTYQPCSTEQFECKNLKCIRQTYVCDGENDCSDNSDEQNCTTKAPCGEGEFQCQSKECIADSLVCNKQSDCKDDSDESPRCDVDECAKIEISQCEQLCIDKPIGYKCACNPGYKLMEDEKACEDIDECKGLQAMCSQVCENVPGSYICKCNETYYEKDLDKHLCKRLDNTQPWLIYSNRYYIRNLTLDSSVYGLMKSGLRNVVALSFDYEDNRLYFSDVGNKVIQRMYINGSNLESIVRHDTHGLEGLAVDWVGKKIYWLDRNAKRLDVSELNGTHRRALVYKYIHDPRGIAVHPGIGRLFFSDWGLQPYIARIGMDGANLDRILTSENKLAWPNALTIDFYANRLYWADAHLDYIGSSDFNGKDIKEVLANVPHVFSITIFDNYMIWTDWNLKGIQRASKLNGSEIVTLRNTTHRPYSVVVYHPLAQPYFENPCGMNNGDCSHLCLIAPGGNSFTCACPDGFTLNSDNRTCSPKCSDGQMRCGPSDDRCIPLAWRCDGDDDCKDGIDEPRSCPARLCKTGMFQCQNNNCTSSVNICDGRNDCGDNSDESICPTMCAEHQFKCATVGQCIPKSWECDGNDDCADRSDEDPTNCRSKTCEPELEFSCRNGKCIPKIWYCDSDDDCGDNSDEPAHLCRNRNCNHGWQKCPGRGNYRCIPTWLFCDGRDNCRDMSDETNPQFCPPCHNTGDFKCKNNRCIPRHWMCDFEDDCTDNSDEDPTMCAHLYRNCSETEFRCNNRRCIQHAWQCDGDDDCGDNSDEKSCETYQCQADQFKCSSGQCIGNRFRCDGELDCFDASDENNCSSRFPNGRHCAPSQFQCTNRVCIKSDFVCDGDNDCGDQSDEENCRDKTCDTTQKFLCDNSVCISKWQLCNGIDNCGDGSDENNLSLCKPQPRTCTSTEYKCSNHKCVPREKVCDHYDDCGDRSDELGCHYLGSCSEKHSCLQNCTDISRATQKGYICHCKSGYITDTANPKNCIDVDECSSLLLNNCSQTCINEKGDFVCKCKAGFTAVGSSCAATGYSTLVFLEGPYIMNYVLETRETGLLVHGETRIQTIDYDPIDNLIYWTDMMDRTIRRSHMFNESGQFAPGLAQDLQIKGLSQPKGIAIDWIARNLYWTDTNITGMIPTGNIYVGLLDGRYKRSLAHKDIEIPTDIAVAPELGMMFWTDAGSVPRLEGAWMDGTHRYILVADRIALPTGLAIDSAMNHRLYWVDPKLDSIESVSWQGNDRVTIKSGAAHPYNMDVFENAMFWVTQGKGALYKQDKFGRGVQQQIIENRHSLMDVKIFHPQRYNRSIHNPCLSARCTHLCLLVPRGHRCACPGTSATTGPEGRACLEAFEDERRAPLRCHCRNGGWCIDSQMCSCPNDYTGMLCEYHLETDVAPLQNSATSATAIVVPIIIIPLFIVIGLIIILYWRRRMRNKKSNFGGSNQSVSFREGTNVHFDSPEFMSNGSHDHHNDPLSVEFNVTDGKSGDISNPLYDLAFEGMDSSAAAEAGKGIYEVPAETFMGSKKGFAYNNEVATPGSAVISPSSIVHKASPQVMVRQTTLNPTTKDTDKDTAKLVEEDKSDC